MARKKIVKNFDFHGVQIVQDGAEFDNRKDAVEHLVGLGVDKAQLKGQMESHLDFAEYTQSNYVWYIEQEKPLAYERIQTTRKKSW